MILTKDIIQEGHETLKKVAKDVKLPLSNEDNDTLIEMVKYLFMSQNSEQASEFNIRPAVGIAAPQINISKRMFCVFTYDEDGNNHNIVAVNPTITKKSKEIIYLESGEGCLSTDPNVMGIVPRHAWIEVSTHLLDFKTNKLVKKKIRLKEFISIVFQHEYDHLDGIMFTDKVITDIPKNYRKID